jgi:NAD(P)-dependent dehydrogenase (short-subunit alcohol dehydrogenase family)
MEDQREQPLAGRRVVIVGGTSGMGLATAKAALRAGAHVIAAGRRPASARTLDASAAAVVQETVDITDENSVRALFDRVGTLDHLLVTSTPPTRAPGKFLEQDVEAAQQFMRGKFFGSWACARWAAPRMPHGGSITFVSGGAGLSRSFATSTTSQTSARSSMTSGATRRLRRASRRRATSNRRRSLNNCWPKVRSASSTRACALPAAPAWPVFALRW